jgi:glycosyltransferase involved in cell wall biosynthesis
VRQVPASVVEAEIKAAHKPEDKFETVLFLPEGEGRKGEGGLRTQGYFKQSQEGKPLITVVTVVFNGEKFLEETILSVINQTYDNVEYIIIDGGSTDGTLDIIKKYEHAIDYWVSEKDKGIYDAMNKGLDLATGEWINFMNADDYFIDLNVLDSIAFNGTDLIYGNIILKDNEYFTRSGSMVNIDTLLYKNICHHQASFTRKKAFKAVGRFDDSLKIAADYDFFVRCFFKHVNESYVNQDIAVMRMDGLSTMQFNQSLSEKLSVIKKHWDFFSYMKAWLFQFGYERPRFQLRKTLIRFGLISYWRSIRD